MSVHKPYGQMKQSTLDAVQSRLTERLSFSFSWHDGRRYVQTALEEAGWSHNWIQKVKGRKIRGEDNPYSLPEIEKLREAYKHALPNLCFLDVEAMVAKKEMDSVKLIVGEQSLRERELTLRIEKLEKKLGWVGDPDKFKDVVEGLRLLREKEKGK